VGRGKWQSRGGAEKITSPVTVVGLPKNRVKLDEGFSKSFAPCQDFPVRHLAKKSENAESAKVFA
jgi:hypothetical protein